MEREKTTPTPPAKVPCPVCEMPGLKKRTLASPHRRSLFRGLLRRAALEIPDLRHVARDALRVFALARTVPTFRLGGVVVLCHDLLRPLPMKLSDVLP